MIEQEKRVSNFVWYEKLAEYYDYFDGVQVPYEEVVEIIDETFKKYGIRTVLDFACGTGGFTVPLRKKGYEVIGVDKSPSMLAIAKKKVVQAGLEDILLYEGDMRSFEAGRFDALTCMFNSVGDLTREGFLLTLHNMRHNLKDGSLLFFDVLNYSFSEGQEQPPYFFLDSTFQEESISGIRMSKNTLNREEKTMEVEQIVTISVPGKDSQEIFVRCIMQMYNKEEIDDFLKVAGFELIRNFGNFSAERGLESFSDKESPFVGVLAKAK